MWLKPHVLASKLGDMDTDITVAQWESVYFYFNKNDEKILDAKLSATKANWMNAVLVN